MKNQLPTLDDMIFEQRNKLYGAYELRQTYGNSLRKATLYGVAAMLFVTGSSFVYFRNQPEKEKIVIYDGGSVVIPPPPKEEVVTPPPPPIEETPPAVVEQKQYLPPVPVIDELVIEEIVPPNQSDLDGAQIGTVNVTGVKTDALIYDTPPLPLRKIDDEITDIKPVELPFTTVEMMPEFEGGVAEMYRWLGKNLNYPSAAVRAGVEGKVFVKFIVEKDGSVSQLEVMKGIGFGCDEESLRVLKTMPKWIPGMQNGKPARVYFTIPIAFKLQ